MRSVGYSPMLTFDSGAHQEVRSWTVNQPSDSAKACQSPGYITFSLDKGLESLPHAFGVD
jgi:hypothetical protein